MNTADLIRHLVDTRIAGDVNTPRESNVANITKMLDRQWDYHFGLTPDREWTPDEVLKLLAHRVGIDPDPARVRGADRIDPERTLEAVDAAAEVLADAAARQARVLVATGHPTGVLSLHLLVAARLAAAGARVLTPAAEQPVQAEHLSPRSRIRYLGDVAMLSNGADFLHTHAAEPMQAVLAAALAAGIWPDLVVADHGWAGTAAQAGITTIGLADTNDPAMFVGAEEGKVTVAVPLDDNVAPAHYLPLAERLLRRLPGAPRST
jgi:Phosphatase